VYPALLAGLLAAVIAVAVATWLARRFARPIRRLVAQTATIAQGDFTPMAVARRTTSLRDLAESINRMTAHWPITSGKFATPSGCGLWANSGRRWPIQLRNAATGGRMAIELHRRDCPHGPGDESLTWPCGSCG